LQPERLSDTFSRADPRANRNGRRSACRPHPIVRSNPRTVRGW